MTPTERLAKAISQVANLPKHDATEKELRSALDAFREECMGQASRACDCGRNYVDDDEHKPTCASQTPPSVSISPARLACLEACEREADAANTWEIAWDNDAENVNEKWRDYQKARTARDAARSKL